MLVQEIVNQFRLQTILVLGDTYIDREIYGDVLRLAPEAPVPVVKVSSKRLIPGGAANIAKNISLLGGQAILCGAFGTDDISRKMLNGLPELFKLLTVPVDADFRLPERNRIFAANQQLLQIWKKPTIASVSLLAPLFVDLFSAQETFARTVIIYDQGYGFVSEELLQAVLKTFATFGLKVIIDANPEHVHWYREATLYTFNSEESLRAVDHLDGSASNVDEAGEILRDKLRSDVLITQGREGMTIFPRSSKPQKVASTRVPIADRAGAGDSVTAVLALCLASGTSLKEAAELANKAAGVVVAKTGIAYVSPAELTNLFHQEISQLLLESVEVKQRLLREQLPAIECVVKMIIDTCRTGRTVFAFGNGGSAADANHFITELVGRFQIERKAFPAMSFSTNEILMTSIANDYGYENTFARQVDAFVKEGDLVVAFSTSGKSKNVVVALELVKTKNAHAIGFTGSAAGELPRLCDVCIRVPSDSTPRIQESHLAVVHIICELLERELSQVS